MPRRPIEMDLPWNQRSRVETLLKCVVEECIKLGPRQAFRFLEGLCIALAWTEDPEECALWFEDHAPLCDAMIEALNDHAATGRDALLAIAALFAAMTEEP